MAFGRSLNLCSNQLTGQYTNVGLSLMEVRLGSLIPTHALTAYVLSSVPAVIVAVVSHGFCVVLRRAL